MAPKIRYAKTDDGVHIAYTAMGDGPPLVVSPPGGVTIEWAWDDRLASAFFDRLASFSQLILFDKRGTGASDPIVGAPTLEDRVADIRAVMDTTGTPSAVVAGLSEGGSMSAMFAATHPARTSGLVLYSTLVRVIGRYGDDDPFIGSADQIDMWLSAFERSLETGTFPPDMNHPTVANDPEFILSSERRRRMSASPAMHVAISRLNAQIDIRPILDAIRVPSLVLHREGELIIRAEHSRWIADHIPGARFVGLPGQDHFPWIGDMDPIVSEIQEFVTGDRPPPPSDRVLATVLLTDLVASTEHIAAIGDKRWKELITRHNVLVREEIERHRGRLVRFTGDGALATFDGPARAVRCAQTIARAMADLGLRARAGLHSGEIELIGEDITGLAVHIASRVTGLAGPDEVLASSAVRDLSVGSGIAFVDRGSHRLRGVPDRWQIFEAKAA